MDENKKEKFDNELQDDESKSVEKDDYSQEETAEKSSFNENETDELNGDFEENEQDDDDDGAFDVNKIASETAFNDFLNGKDDAPEGEDDLQPEGSYETELDVPLATYSVDCEMCATKVYFELDDLDDDGNLICPNCEETIEIDNDAIDFYLVNKPQEEEESTYVVDCPSCDAFFHFNPDDIDEEENIVCPECGENVHIETEVLDAYKESDIEKSHRKRAKRRKITAIVLGIFAGIIVALTALYFIGINSVVKVGTQKVPLNIYKSVYYCECASNYSGNGFDISKKPSKQAYEDSDEYKTWDDFLKKQTSDTLKIYYSIYNAGQKAGYKLTDDDKENIDSTIKQINSYAEKSEISFEDYIYQNYGIKMTEKQIRPYLEMSQYVNSYYKQAMSKYVTDADMEKLYKADPDKYDVVSFRYFNISIKDDMTKAKAEVAAKDIATAKTEEEFHTKAKKYVSSSNAANYKEDDSTLIKDIACSNVIDRPISDVITSAKSKKGDVAYGVSSDGTYAEVAMLVTPRHKSEDTLKTAAISEAASSKGDTYISDLTKNVEVKSGLGMVVRNILF